MGFLSLSIHVCLESDFHVLYLFPLSSATEVLIHKLGSCFSCLIWTVFVSFWSRRICWQLVDCFAIVYFCSLVLIMVTGFADLVVLPGLLVWTDCSVQSELTIIGQYLCSKLSRAQRQETDAPPRRIRWRKILNNAKLEISTTLGWRRIMDSLGV